MRYHHQVARSVGCTVSNWEVREDGNGRLGFQTSDLKNLMTPQTKLVVVNFPHNPTGMAYLSVHTSSLTP